MTCKGGLYFGEKILPAQRIGFDRAAKTMTGDEERDVGARLISFGQFRKARPVQQIHANSASSTVLHPTVGRWGGEAVAVTTGTVPIQPDYTGILSRLALRWVTIRKRL